MKGGNILCVSQASTAICMTHMDHIHPSSPPPSSSSSSAAAAAIQYGGRTIDRHNPIIRDSRRPTLHAPCSSSPRAAVTPAPYHQLIQKNPPKKKNKKSSGHEQNKRKSTSSVPIFTSKLFTVEKKQPDRTVTVNADKKKKELEEDGSRIAELITPAGSSRYLLSETDYVDGLSSDLPDPIVELQQVVPAVQEQKLAAAAVHQDDDTTKKSSSSRFKSDQVVVLRVSLHCKGCEGKVRKHISRMEGVTSFNIDFKAKKVTVVGDVTPLGVLASVSKVKTAQLWTSTSTTPLDHANNST